MSRGSVATELGMSEPAAPVAVIELSCHLTWLPLALTLELCWQNDPWTEDLGIGGAVMQAEQSHVSFQARFLFRCTRDLFSGDPY